MELKKLTRENLGGRTKRGMATISFTRRGLVILSHVSVSKLGLENNSLVDVLEGEQSSEFFICNGTTYKVRKNGDGGVVFNCVVLCGLVIERTWRIAPHIVSESCPNKVTFIICDKPVDDKENSHVFALLRKKV